MAACADCNAAWPGSLGFVLERFPGCPACNPDFADQVLGNVPLERPAEPAT